MKTIYDVKDHEIGKRLGATHVRILEVAYHPGPPALVGGRLTLGYTTGRVRLVLRGGSLDLAGQFVPTARFHEEFLEGERFALLRARAESNGAPMGEFRWDDVVDVALGKINPAEVKDYLQLVPEEEVVEDLMADRVPAEAALSGLIGGGQYVPKPSLWRRVRLGLSRAANYRIF